MQGKHSQTFAVDTSCVPTGLGGGTAEADTVLSCFGSDDDDAALVAGLGSVDDMAAARADSIRCRSFAATDAPKQSAVPAAICLLAAASCAANMLGSPPIPLLLFMDALVSAASAAFSFTSATGSLGLLSERSGMLKPCVDGDASAAAEASDARGRLLGLASSISISSTWSGSLRA